MLFKENNLRFLQKPINIWRQSPLQADRINLDLKAHKNLLLLMRGSILVTNRQSTSKAPG
jgi:hypothetical protein